MTFIAIVVVFIIMQLAGSVDAMQSDAWFRDWSARTRGWLEHSAGALLLQLLVPVLGLWLLLDLADRISALLLFLLTLPLLIYSLGRGDVSEWVQGYIDASRRHDNEVATDYAGRLGVDIDTTTDWSSLHRGMLQCTGYRGFERWFVVLFWFVVLGPLGAVFYRLAVLSAGDADNTAEVRSLARRLVWIMEWPAVRLFGLSLALTGNFSSCFNHCADTFFDGEQSSEAVLEKLILGALNVNTQGLAAEEVSDREVEALQPLLSRTLVLWICVLAVLSLL